MPVPDYPEDQGLPGASQPGAAFPGGGGSVNVIVDSIVAVSAAGDLSTPISSNVPLDGVESPTSVGSPVIVFVVESGSLPGAALPGFAVPGGVREAIGVSANITGAEAVSSAGSPIVFFLAETPATPGLGLPGFTQPGGQREGADVATDIGGVEATSQISPVDVSISAFAVVDGVQSAARNFHALGLFGEIIPGTTIPGGGYEYLVVVTTSTANVEITILGVQSTSSAGTLSETGTSTLLLTGSQAVTVPGVMQVRAGANVVPSGTSCSGVLGASVIHGTAAIAFVGASGFGQSGPVAGGGQNDATALVTSASATGAAGALSLSGDAIFTTTGVSAAGAVNVLAAGSARVSLIGVGASGAVGAIPYVIGTASVGVSGVQAAGIASPVAGRQDVVADIPGTESQALAGDVGYVASAVASVGSTLSVGFTENISDVVGTANVDTPGASAFGSAGFPAQQGDVFAEINGTEAASAAGDPGFFADCSAAVFSSIGTLLIGDVSVTIISHIQLNLSGISAAGIVGRPKVHVRKHPGRPGSVQMSVINKSTTRLTVIPKFGTKVEIS